MKKLSKLSKTHRLIQRFNNWAYEFADQKVMLAAFLFLLSCLIWADRFMR